MIYTWFSIPNLVTDVAMLALPLPAIWTLKMSRGQKVGLTLTFLTGSMQVPNICTQFTEKN
jgi:hypothetical protein